jgi:hypothetical protein
MKTTKLHRRALDSEMATVQNISKSRRSSDQVQRHLPDILTLKELRNIERATPHLWDEDERTLLAVLYRWYDETDSTTIPKVFNGITGLGLRHHIVQRQFRDHMVLYGVRAYSEFGKVLKIPFHDADGYYEDIHAIIQDTAAELGLRLRRRKVEEKLVLGKAQFHKSPTTRKYWKARVRLMAQQEKERAAQKLKPKDSSTRVARLGGFAMTTTWDESDDEVIVDAEDLSTHLLSLTALRSDSHNKNPHIGLRVWDDDSRTKFSEETGFVSEAFTIWRGRFPSPFSPDGQGKQALMLLTNLHLSMKGGASCFVSVSTSLLQVMVKASTMKRPRIAVGV